jgi:hypothetical protein
LRLREESQQRDDGRRDLEDMFHGDPPESCEVARTAAAPRPARNRACGIPEMMSRNRFRPIIPG